MKNKIENDWNEDQIIEPMIKWSKQKLKLIDAKCGYNHLKQEREK